MVDKILAVAASYIGVKESPKGSNNVIFNTHYYGKPVSGPSYPWCVVFVWDVFRLAGLSSLFYAGNKAASCTVVKNWARLNSQWAIGGYRRGDVVVFDWDDNGSTDHMGIVESVSSDGKALSTIEGNTGSISDSNGGEVMRRTRNVKYVVGAFRPAYVEGDDMASIIEEIAKTANLSVDETKKRLAAAIKDDAWEQVGIDWLVEKNLINQVRPAGAPISWGEFGIVLSRALSMENNDRV
jgi:hypothetical protein